MALTRSLIDMGTPGDRDANKGSHVILRSGRRVYAIKLDRDGSRKNEPDIPLLFVHGFNHSSNTWVPLYPHLQEYTRIAFDVEPHGYTGSLGGSLTMKQHAEDASNVLEYFGYSKAIVVGHSAGTLIVHQFAHDFPQKAVKLIYLGPPKLPYAPRPGESAEGIANVNYDNLFKTMKNWTGSRKRDDPELLAFLNSEPRRHQHVKPLIAQWWVQMTQFKFPGTNGVEAWIIKGTEDGAVAPDACETIRDLTNGRIIELQTGHFFTREDPKGTADAIRMIADQSANVKARL